MPRTILTAGSTGLDREIDEIHRRIDTLANAAGSSSQAPVTQILQQVTAPSEVTLTVTADAQLVNESWIFVDATAGDVIITLPASSGASHPVGVKKIDSSGHTVTVTAAGSDTIEGAATSVLSAQWASLFLVPDGTSTWGSF